MNDLLDKFNEYRSIVNYTLYYELENGINLRFKLKQTDFPHLIGLHKLIDIPIIRQFNDKSNKTVSAKYLIQKIKQQSLLTEKDVKNSLFYSDIENRYINFGKNNILTVSYTDAIVNFDASLIGSSLAADYILYEKREGGYNHLCIAKDKSGNRYAESYFYNQYDLYIKGQNVIGIKEIKIYDANGNIYLEDTL